MNNEVSAYIKKQKSPEKEICQKLRSLILKTLPDAQEEMRWGVPLFNKGRFYIASLQNHVNLGFSINGLTKEEAALFEGGGKTMKLVAKKSKCEE